MNENSDKRKSKLGGQEEVVTKKIKGQRRGENFFSWRIRSPKQRGLHPEQKRRTKQELARRANRETKDHLRDANTDSIFSNLL